MALTQQVKSELATVRVQKPETRAAELATMLRFSGGLHVVSGHIVIEADVGVSGAKLAGALLPSRLMIDCRV